jgi:alkane 1-monooxygenase
MHLRFFKYASVYITVAIILFSMWKGGIWIFLAPVYAFGVIPLLELFFQGSPENLSQAEEELARKDWKYDLIVWSVVPIQLTTMVYFLYRVSDPSLRNWEIAGMIIAFGISCGVLGINVAHELGHRTTWYEKTMSKMLLATSLYMHFYIEHNRGHHKNVSTSEDPASARYGENIYAFYFRSVKDSWLSAWRIEQERLKNSNRIFISIRNEMLVFQIIQLLLLAGIASVWNWNVMIYFMGAASLGFLLLETVNYIEHYGLRRKKIDSDRYERVMPTHSWNSDHPVGRIMLFELTRHSDHHYMTSRKFQILRHLDESPQMPTGYPGMMVLSLFPPLWFKVMHRTMERYKVSA